MAIVWFTGEKDWLASGTLGSWIKDTLLAVYGMFSPCWNNAMHT